MFLILAYALEAGPLWVVPRVGLSGLLAVGLEAPGVVTAGLKGKLIIGFGRHNIAGACAEGWFRSLRETFGLGCPRN